MQERTERVRFLASDHTFRKNLNLVKKPNVVVKHFQIFFIWHKTLVGGGGRGVKGSLAPPTPRVLQWRNLTIDASLNTIKHILDD